MRNRSRKVYLSAAVTAALFGAASGVRASSLTWDADGASGVLGQDGDGTWDTTTPNWVNGDFITGTNVTWNNATPDSAILGSSTSTNAGTTAYTIDLGAPIVAQDITFQNSADGKFYNITDFGGGSLTLNGNLTKSLNTGNPQILLLSNAMTLGTGNHVFTANDTGGDNLPEVTLAATLAGAGGVTIDNQTFVTWGTVAFTGAGNTYAGNTNINNGRLEITHSDGLGATTAGTTIGDLGTLSIGGSNTTVASPLTIAEPITIKRSIYAGGTVNDGTAYEHYKAAIISTNGSGTTTFTGPLVIDSTDARIQANTLTIVLPNGVSQGPDVTNGVLTLDGDFAGFVTLSGDNTAFVTAGGGFKIIGGVEVNVSSEANFGGATSSLALQGGFIHPTGTLATSPFMTNFGTHVLVGGTVGTGVDLDAGVTFNVNGLSGGGVGERGIGTLNLAGTNTFTGTPSYDGGLDPSNAVNGRGGTINIQSGATVTQVGLRVRSATVNVNGTFNVGGSFTSLGLDTGGTSGQPDLATININNGGSLIESTGDDFNISDNANTQGTINLHAGGVLTTGGVTWLGKNNGAVGTINQDGGTLTINRGGNFGFVIADGRGNKSPTGHYNLSGGTFTSAGEVYVGEGGNSAQGFWNQTGGTANVNNWFVVGREGAQGFVDISGGTLNHNGGNMSLGDSNNGGTTYTINVHGTGIINDTGGELWVGNNGGAVTVMTVSDAASVSANNWLAVGRGGGTGTLTISGTATVTQSTANWLTIGSNGTGTVNVNGGTLNALQAYIGEVGGSNGTLNVNGGNVNITNNSIFANAGTETGNLNLNTGGTLTAFGFTANNGGGTGTGTFFFNGGSLLANADNATFIGAKVSSVVSTGGAKISPNGHTVTINSALKHDTALSGADGGLTVSGAGTLILASNISTYTGNTSVTGGTLTLNVGNASPNYSTASGATLNLNSSILTTANVTSNGTVNFGGNSTAVTTTRSIGALTVNTGGLATIKSSSFPFTPAVLQPSSVALNGTGTFDLTNNELIIPSTTETAVRGQISGGKIVTTTAGLGVGSLALTASKIETRATLLGDTNLDGNVDVTDLGNLASSYGATTGALWVQGDTNYDNAVDVTDLGNLASNYGGHLASGPSDGASAMLANSLASVASSGSSAVPEPASLSLLAIGAVAGLGRRRRRVTTTR